MLAVDSAITSQNRLEYRARMHESLVSAGIDLVATPAQAFTPPHIGVTEVPFAGEAAFDVTFAMCGLTQIFNILGWPAISVPSGRDDAEHAGRPPAGRAAVAGELLPGGGGGRRGRRDLTRPAAVDASSRSAGSATTVASVVHRSPSAAPGSGWQHIALAPPRCDAMAARTAAGVTVSRTHRGHPPLRQVQPQDRARRLADGGVAVAAGVLDEVVRVDEDAAVVGRDEARARGRDLDRADRAAVLVGDDR